MRGKYQLTREFIMTPEFDKTWAQLGLDDNDLIALQEQILLNPQVGAVIQGTSGLRKMRFALNAGKSSGVRVLYVDLVLLEEVYLISAYAKSTKSNLTNSEKSEIKKLIELLKKSAFERMAKNEL